MLVNKIRLAHVYQWQGDFDRAEQLYQEVWCHIKANDDCTDMLDFAYQHWAKCKFDRQDYEEAMKLFHQALEIRIKKADPDLIGSTQHAIKVTRMKMAQ